jgi:hypothetical protein
MAAEDLARALIRLDSDYIRDQVARGDLSDFEEFGFELSDYERELLVQATARVRIEDEVAVTLPGEERVEPAGEGGPGRAMATSRPPWRGRSSTSTGACTTPWCRPPSSPGRTYAGTNSPRPAEGQAGPRLGGM